MTSPKPRLTAAGRAFLLRLLNDPRHEEFSPTGNRQAALSAANWYRTSAPLERARLVIRVSAGGGCIARLTADGLQLAEAEALKAHQPLEGRGKHQS